MDESPKQGFAEKLRKLIKKEDVRSDEVLAAVKEFENQGFLEAEEAEMISNVMEFSDTNAGDIMTHRTKIVGIPLEDNVETALRFMLDENHSRYPVFDDSIDNITGILYLKDLMIAYMAGNGNDLVSTVEREPLFVPEAMPIDTLFNELRLKRTHLAIVVDEYGQTAGIVTMEDIIEEIVGDILDEYDVEENNISKTSNGSISISPEMKLDELGELIHIKFEDEDYESFDTINGLLIAHLGHIPEKGERSQIEYGGFEISFSSKEGRVISDIQVKPVTK
jgi:putative hemolysin